MWIFQDLGSCTAEMAAPSSVVTPLGVREPPKDAATQTGVLSCLFSGYLDPKYKAAVAPRPAPTAFYVGQVGVRPSPRPSKPIKCEDVTKQLHRSRLGGHVWVCPLWMRP